MSGAAIAVLATLAAVPAHAEEESGPFAVQNFSSTIYLTNQYMFRGISNSDGPAI
jgi:hypothetical protein